MVKALPFDHLIVLPSSALPHGSLQKQQKSQAEMEIIIESQAQHRLVTNTAIAIAGCALSLPLTPCSYRDAGTLQQQSALAIIAVSHLKLAEPGF